MQTLSIYTDGGCKYNPGPGAWAFVVTDGKQVLFRDSNGISTTTNNEMELTAVIKALEWYHANVPGQRITIYSDSQYAINCINIWYDKWKRERTLDKKKNVPLIEHAVSLKTPLISFQWVKGHSTNPYNNLADHLVGFAIKQAEPPRIEPEYQEELADLLWLYD